MPNPTNVIELKNDIIETLNSLSPMPDDASQEVKEQSRALKEKLAQALATNIDQYIQYQIGTRLKLILEALTISFEQDFDTNVVQTITLQQGQQYNSLIKTE